MPGAYAHIAVVNDAQKRIDRANLCAETALALGLHLKYLELGSVSPDYPYLSIRLGQSKWADLMHYTRNASLLRRAVAVVAGLSPTEKPRATAWLFGFAAHMATDMTIHPVVELRVGPYKGNEGEHRRCEMHQDAFIFPHVMNVGDTGLSKHLDTGIAACHAPHNEDEIDPVISKVWLSMLDAAYPAQPGIQPAQPDSWHSGFRGILKTTTGINHLFPFARHVSAKLNLTYPAVSDINPGFIYQLATPEGPMDYEALFARARGNVLAAWGGLDEALTHGRSDALDQLEDWDLDTGRSVQTGMLVFWKNPS